MYVYDVCDVVCRPECSSCWPYQYPRPLLWAATYAAHSLNSLIYTLVYTVVRETINIGEKSCFTKSIYQTLLNFVSMLLCSYLTSRGGCALHLDHVGWQQKQKFSQISWTHNLFHVLNLDGDCHPPSMLSVHHNTGNPCVGWNMTVEHDCGTVWNSVEHEYGTVWNMTMKHYVTLNWINLTNFVSVL